MTSTPDGATVSLDANTVGTTPWAGVVSSGVSHDVVISKRGYESERRSARAEADGDQTVNIDLWAAISARPDGSLDSNSAPMVLVSAGEFLMGSASSDSQASDNEWPQHRVTLKAFHIDKYEVTNGQYNDFLKRVRNDGHGSCDPGEPSGKDHTPSTTSWNDAEWNAARQPVVSVDWYDAAAFCAWAGKRLPTEAEWERAARGTDGRIYPWGSDLPGAFLQGNFADERARRIYPGWTWTISGYDDGFAATAPVGAFSRGASPYGAEDMAGNVWEWVRDWYDENYYRNDPPRENPEGPSSGQRRVLRGGSWSSAARELRTAYRFGMIPTQRNSESYRTFNYGFRCAQDQK